MRLKKWVAVVMVPLTVLSLIVGVVGNSAFADKQVKCPAGTLRAGKTATSYAECNMEEVDDDEKVTAVGTRIINFASGTVGFISVAVIVIGAIYIATSAGDPGKVKRGQLSIIYGLVGVVIAFLAFAIVNFVITNVFKS